MNLIFFNFTFNIKEEREWQIRDIKDERDCMGKDKGWLKLEKCNKCLDNYKIKLIFWNKLICKYKC